MAVPTGRATTRALVAITPAMREGTGLVAFHARFPDRFFDVGIAEQHAVTFAAGLACEGMRPVVAIYSTFLQRAYDQVVHDVALQNLPVIFALDRAGLVGADGATHHGVFDLAYLRCLPNLVVMAPPDEDECRRMLNTAFRLGDAGGRALSARHRAGRRRSIPRSRRCRWARRRSCAPRRSRIAILAFGAPLDAARAAAERLDATVVNMRFVKPLDVATSLELARTHDALVTVEENVIAGGAGSAVAEALAAAGIALPILHLGLPDVFVDHGDPATLLAACGLDAEGIVRAVEARFGARRKGPRVKPAA